MNTNSATGCLNVEFLAQHSSKYIRRVVASDPAASPELLRVLANDPDGSVGLAASLNPRCPFEVLENLAQASDWNICLGLASQLDVCDDILSVLVNHRNPYIAKQASHALSASAFERKIKELEIVFTPGAEYLIGELLVVSDFASQGQIVDAVKVSQKYCLRLGRVLLQTGLVKAPVLIEALKVQSLLRNQSLMWTEAIGQLKQLTVEQTAD